MNANCLKLTTYLGEHERIRGRFAADVLTELYARHRVEAGILLRGVAGFGARHVRTDRLLTLSEDLPLVSIAVDARDRIEAVAGEVEALPFRGLVTLERARMLHAVPAPVALPRELREATKLTVYVGRRARAQGRPAHLAVVDLLHRRGVAGATVLLGVDGTAHGARRRARLLGRNADVPLMVIAVGGGDRMAAVLPEVAAMLVRPLLTLERIRVCKRDGERLAEPAMPGDVSDGDVWQKLTVYASEQSRHRGQPLHARILHDLRAAGAAGATCVRGIRGYHGAHPPHGDSLWQLRRRVPVLTVVVDRPERIRRWFAIVDALTDETGLVTSEVVPAFRTSGG